jgi:exopolysaccharide biosynthesis polyprenyl glycosylphosphotransferase
MLLADQIAAIATSDLARPRVYISVKRIFDALTAAGLLCILFPIFLLCALAIRLDSPGPILFRQTRVGENGKTFPMLKFRSMYVDADPALHQLFMDQYIKGTNAAVGTESARIFKMTRDPRITRPGRWLRATSLDELPQLWNVLVGDMSLVGPRPPIPYEVERYQPNHMIRLATKPGITGLWQVSGRNSTTFEEMVKLDVDYIRRRSIMLDLWILLKTIPTVLGRTGM